ncbi:MAG: glycosyltransferase family 4 protein, partial [Pseudomonadota bacterium]
DYAAEVTEAAREAGLDLIVTGRLSLDDIKRLYARAICNILLAENVPGRREGFGLVLVEAAALGCPSIASDVGGIPEALGETGAKVPAGDIEAAARAASRFAADDQYRADAAEAAREHARAFSWVACAAATFPELRLA